MSVADVLVPPPRGLAGWLKGHVPTREGIQRNRWLRPVAHRLLAPSLWRFTRRSVPRGVALGLLAGTLLPVAHIPCAALLAVPLRANIAVAVSASLANNPLTFGPLLWGAYRLGHWLLQLDAAVPGRPLATGVGGGHSGVLHWLVAGGPPIIVGLLAIAAVLSTAGYFLTALAWRVRIARRWRNRRHRNG